MFVSGRYLNSTLRSYKMATKVIEADIYKIKMFNLNIIIIY